MVSGQPYQVKIFQIQGTEECSSHASTLAQGRSKRSRSRSSSRHRHSRRRNVPSSHHHVSSGSHHTCPAANSYWVWRAQALLDKLACRTCFNEATKEKESDAREVTDLIRESMRESILEASAPETGLLKVLTPQLLTLHCRRNPHPTARTWNFQQDLISHQSNHLPDQSKKRLAGMKWKKHHAKSVNTSRT